MPNCPMLLAFAPLAMGAFILLFMDLSFNVTMQPFPRPCDVEQGRFRIG